MQIKIGAVLALSLLLVLGLTACFESPAAVAPKATQLSSLLGAPETAGYAQALTPREFNFPADHGPHPAYRSEWWYWTGNLSAEDGRAFGYQFTVFRFALAPLSAAPLSAATERASQWGARETWLAHLTLSDVDNKKFYAFERAGRGALDLAGATAVPFRVHCDGWEATEQIGGAALGSLRIHADAGAVALDLILAPGKPRVLHGDRGLSRKGPEPGNASYYYSQTRMPTTGSLRVSGQEYRIAGNSWMDREWSTSALAPGVVGWDWFALQLTDGREVMLYRLRRADGSATEFSSGALIAVDGSHTPLTAEQFTITASATWASRTGVIYPSQWRLQTAGLDLQIIPAIADQELDLTVRYWEGAVTIHEVTSGRSAGVGYVELAGYPALP